MLCLLFNGQLLILLFILNIFLGLFFLLLPLLYIFFPLCLQLLLFLWKQLQAHVLKFFVHNLLFDRGVLVQLNAKGNVCIPNKGVSWALGSWTCIRGMEISKVDRCNPCGWLCSPVISGNSLQQKGEFFFHPFKLPMLDRFFDRSNICFPFLIVMPVSSSCDSLWNVFVHECFQRSKVLLLHWVWLTELEGVGDWCCWTCTSALLPLSASHRN